MGLRKNLFPLFPHSFAFAFRQSSDTDDIVGIKREKRYGNPKQKNQKKTGDDSESFFSGYLFCGIKLVINRILGLQTDDQVFIKVRAEGHTAFVDILDRERISRRYRAVFPSVIDFPNGVSDAKGACAYIIGFIFRVYDEIFVAVTLKSDPINSDLLFLSGIEPLGSRNKHLRE